MPLEIRLVKDSEYKEVNDFFNKARNINHKEPRRTYDQFCWEFINGPWGKAIYAGAWEVDEGKNPTLVGIQCLIPLKMISSDGKCVLTAKGEDSLIDISAFFRYRKTDILRELQTLIFEDCDKRGIELVWGFNTMYATNKRLGFENTVKSYYYVLVVKPGQAFRNSIIQKPGISTFRKYRIAALSAISYLFSLKRLLFISSIGSYQFNSGIDENAGLFRRASFPDRLFLLLQDKAYLKWRIQDNPYPVKYRSYQLLDKDNVLQAQVICSIIKDVAFIEQTLFDKRLKKRTVRFILKKVIRSLKNEDICMVRYIGFKSNTPNTEEIKMFKNIGFVHTKKGEQVCFINLAEDVTINPENVYLSRLYKQGIN